MQGFACLRCGLALSSVSMTFLKKKKKKKSMTFLPKEKGAKAGNAPHKPKTQQTDTLQHDLPPTKKKKPYNLAPAARSRYKPGARRREGLCSTLPGIRLLGSCEHVCAIPSLA